ncbi:MAG: DUF1905 domain-containing protein [Thermoleophilia bacterium]|nr:DUF1905 domain-containing protein [Thermoleophilia bacterium]
MTTISTEATVEIVQGQRIARLSEDASQALPSRGQVAVTGALDGAPFATVVEPDGRRGHWIRLDDARSVDEVVTLELRPTKDWPEVVVPQDLQAALDEAPDLADTWRSITPMARWEWVRWVRATRSEATRAKRVDVSISKLRDGKRRPCCFDLAACTDPELARSGKLIAG